MGGSHVAIPLAANLEDQGIGMGVSIPCRNICTECVLPDERGSPEIAETQPDAEQVPTVKQS
jgi:hypothetical protein